MAAEELKVSLVSQAECCATFDRQLEREGWVVKERHNELGTKHTQTHGARFVGDESNGLDVRVE